MTHATKRSPIDRAVDRITERDAARTPDEQHRRRTGRRIGVAATATVVAAVGLVTASALSHPKVPEKPAVQISLTPEQLLQSQENLITGTNKLLDAVVTLGDGTITRPTANFNSDVSIVGDGNLQRKEVVLNQPSFRQDKDGEWLIGTLDTNDNDTLTQKASKLIVVNLDENALHSNTPTSIQIHPNTEGATSAKIIPVDYMDLSGGHGGFENSGSDQQIAGAMTATLQPAA